MSRRSASKSKQVEKDGKMSIGLFRDISRR